MNNNENTTAGHDIPSNDGQNDGIATQQVQQAVRSVMQGELLTLPDMGPTGRPIKTSANLCALIRFQAWLPRYNLMTGEPELAGADGERLGGSEAGQRSALVDACQLAGINQRRSLARLRAPQALTISTRQFRLTRHQVVARQPCLKSNEGAQICTGFDRAASRTHVRQSQQFTLHHRPDSLLNLLCGNAVVLTII